MIYSQQLNIQAVCQIPLLKPVYKQKQMFYDELQKSGHLKKKMWAEKPFLSTRKIKSYHRRGFNTFPSYYFTNTLQHHEKKKQTKKQ